MIGGIGLNPSSKMEAISKERIALFQNDPYGRKLGFNLLEVEPGYALVEAVVTEDKLNFAGAPHGGYLFSLADFAFAAASNSHGRLSVATTVSIQFFSAAKIGDKLLAEAKESHLANRAGFYEVTIRTDTNQKIAHCMGTAHRFERLVTSILT